MVSLFNGVNESVRLVENRVKPNPIRCKLFSLPRCIQGYIMVSDAHWISTESVSPQIELEFYCRLVLDQLEYLIIGHIAVSDLVLNIIHIWRLFWEFVFKLTTLLGYQGFVIFLLLFIFLGFYNLLGIPVKMLEVFLLAITLEDSLCLLGSFLPSYKSVRTSSFLSPIYNISLSGGSLHPRLGFQRLVIQSATGQPIL